MARGRLFIVLRDSLPQIHLSQTAAKIFKENEIIQKELKNANKRISLDQEAAEASQEEIAHLRDTVNKLHGILAKRCDLEGE